MAAISALAGIASVAGIASSVNNLVSGGPGSIGGSSPTNTFVPPGQGQISQQFLGNENVARGLPAYGYNMLNNMGPAFDRAYNNPYQPGLQNNANLAGLAAGRQATNLEGYQGSLGQMGQGLYQSAFDPQNALYNRTLGQMTDQTRGSLAAHGLNSSPLGAGIENDALSNFNIDWQNNLLGRQVQGTNAARQAYGQAGQLGEAIPAMQYNAGQYGNQAYLAGNAGQNAAIQNYMQQIGGIQGLYSNSFSPQLDYLGYAGNQQNLGIQQQYLNQQNAYNQFGAGVSGLQQLPQIFQNMTGTQSAAPIVDGSVYAPGGQYNNP